MLNNFDRRFVGAVMGKENIESTHSCAPLDDPRLDSQSRDKKKGKPRRTHVGNFSGFEVQRFLVCWDALTPMRRNSRKMAAGPPFQSESSLVANPHVYP